MRSTWSSVRLRVTQLRSKSFIYDLIEFIKKTMEVLADFKRIVPDVDYCSEQ